MEKRIEIQEKKASSVSGIFMLLLLILAIIAFTAGIVLAAINESFALITICSVLWVVAFILLFGLRVLKPNEALVLTLFGSYYGTLKGSGFFWVIPFATAARHSAASASLAATTAALSAAAKQTEGQAIHLPSAKMSLKAMTLNNDKQKINDQLGNPIIIGIVVIWRVVNTAKAAFNVDNYVEFLSIQADSALRNTVRLYPYDIADGNDLDKEEKSLRGSSQEISERIRAEIQRNVEIAGLEVTEARITNLAYSPEIAAAMLQRQQAAAIIDARAMIVDGAVSMVEMALSKLSENDVVHLDEERKAAMVSNLLVVLCGNKDAQPIVNSGSIY